MRTVRLGQTFDVILCVGLSLAYLHDNADIAAAFGTFTAHAHLGTVLILQTLTEMPGSTEQRNFRVDTQAASGEVTVAYTSDPHRQLTTMQRRWSLDDGTTAHDLIQRRVLTPEAMHAHSKVRPMSANLDPIGDLFRLKKRLDADCYLTSP